MSPRARLARARGRPSYRSEQHSLERAFEELDPNDMALIWAYDFSWLIIIDLVKMGINALQGGEKASMEDYGTAKGKKVTAQRSSKSQRMSLSGTVMTPRGGAQPVI